MLLNVTGLGVDLRAGLSAAPVPRQGCVSAIRLQSHNARAAADISREAPIRLGSRSRSPRQPHDEVRLSVRFDGRGGSVPGSSDHLLGEVVHAAPQTVFRPHRARQHRRRSDEAVPANAPLVSYELALTVRVEKTAPKATGAASPIPARRTELVEQDHACVTSRVT